MTSVSATAADSVDMHTLFGKGRLGKKAPHDNSYFENVGLNTVL